MRGAPASVGSRRIHWRDQHMPMGSPDRGSTLALTGQSPVRLFSLDNRALLAGDEAILVAPYRHESRAQFYEKNRLN